MTEIQRQMGQRQRQRGNGKHRGRENGRHGTGTSGLPRQTESGRKRQTPTGAGHLQRRDLPRRRCTWGRDRGATQGQRRATETETRAEIETEAGPGSATCGRDAIRERSGIPTESACTREAMARRRGTRIHGPDREAWPDSPGQRQTGNDLGRQRTPRHRDRTENKTARKKAAEEASTMGEIQRAGDSEGESKAEKGTQRQTGAEKPRTRKTETEALGAGGRR